MLGSCVNTCWSCCDRCLITLGYIWERVSIIWGSRVFVFDNLWILFGICFWLCWGHVGVMLGVMFNMFGICFDNNGTMLRSCWEYFRMMFDICWISLGSCLNNCWNHFQKTMCGDAPIICFPRAPGPDPPRPGAAYPVQGNPSLRFCPVPLPGCSSPCVQHVLSDLVPKIEVRGSPERDIGKPWKPLKANTYGKTDRN